MGKSIQMEMSYTSILGLLRILIPLLGWGDDIVEKAEELKQKARDLIAEEDDAIEVGAEAMIDQFLADLGLG